MGDFAFIDGLRFIDGFAIGLLVGTIAGVAAAWKRPKPCKEERRVGMGSRQEECTGLPPKDVDGDGDGGSGNSSSVVVEDDGIQQDEDVEVGKSGTFADLCDKDDNSDTLACHITEDEDGNGNDGESGTASDDRTT